MAFSNDCQQRIMLNDPERKGRQLLDSVCPQKTALLFLLSGLSQGPEKPAQERLETVQSAEQKSWDTSYKKEQVMS